MASATMLPTTPGEPVTQAGGSAGPARAWAALALTCLARLYRAFLLTLVVAATVPMLWSWSDYTVRSGSMEPSIAVGDVVVAKPFSAADDVPVGRVMVFDNPATPDHPELLVHRVMEKLDTGEYATAGDANAANDTMPVTRGRFRARATILVPFVGQPFVWFATGNLVLLLVWGTLTAAAFAVASRRSGGPGSPRRTNRPWRRLRPRRPTSRPRHGAVALRTALLGPIAILVAATALAATGSATAAAAFTSTTANRAMSWQVSNTLQNNLVLTPPGDPVRGTVPLTATLADNGGLSFSVRIEYAVSGTTTWQAVCTKATAPYRCDWATTALANRDYDLRAVATSGSTTYTSAIVGGVLVDNAAPTVTMQDPGTPLRGTVALAATATDAHSGVSRVVVQYAATGSTTYQDACVATGQPWSCSFDTKSVANGSYSFRATATDAAGNISTSTVVTNRIVDNFVSTVTMNDPGALLSGTVSLSAAASSTSGVTSVRIQGAPAGSGTWTDVCTDNSSPYGCSYNTTVAPDGLYDLRAILTDGAGRTTISAIVEDRKVDNTAPRAVDVQTANGGGISSRLDPKDTISLTYSELIQLASVVPAGTAARWA